MFETNKPPKGSKGGRPEIILSESQIRWAMEFSQSNTQAAKMLGVAYDTYIKWAKHYRDEETGKTLFEIQYPGYQGQGLGHAKFAIPLEKIFNNQHPLYPDYRLKRRLIAEGLVECECNQCGFSEPRITDDKVPLLLDYIDGDKTNKAFENLQLLCLNCYFLLVGTPYNRRKAEFE